MKPERLQEQTLCGQPRLFDFDQLYRDVGVIHCENQVMVEAPGEVFQGSAATSGDQIKRRYCRAGWIGPVRRIGSRVSALRVEIHVLVTREYVRNIGVVLE